MRYRDEKSADVALNMLRGMRRIDDDGKIYLSTQSLFVEHDDAESILLSSIDFGPNTSVADAEAILHRTIFSDLLRIKFSKNDFLAEANKQRQLLRARDLRPFRVVYEVQGFPSFKRRFLRMDNVTLDLKPSLQGSFGMNAAQDRAEKRKASAEIGEFQTHGKTQPLVALVRATNGGTALEEASYCAEQVFGLLNYLINRGQSWRKSFHPRNPINSLRAVPLITAHHRTGASAFDGFQYYSTWVEPRQVRLKENQHQVYENLFWRIWDTVQNSAWRESAQEALVMYNDAFDKPDLGEAFITGWRLLEALTGSEAGKTDKIITRASATFAESDFAEAMLRHLRFRRNEIIHRNRKYEDGEVLAFQLKRMLEPIMLIYLENPFSFRSKEELWRFLDLTPNEAKIEELERFAANARRFRGIAEDD